jgi:predicted RNA-binding Zn ribbon-like protein
MPEPARTVLAFASDTLGDPDEFSSWIAKSGLLAARPFVGDAQLDDAAVLRDAIARSARAIAEGKAIPRLDAATINSFADEDPPRLALRQDGTLSRTAAAPLPAALSSIARAAIELLVTRAADLRICEAADCGQLFLDDSRGRRRRWCSMTRCGNRAKALAFRERHLRDPYRTAAT